MAVFLVILPRGISEDIRDFLDINEDLPFYCLECHPRQHYFDVIFDEHFANNDTTLSSCEYSDAHSSDFEWVTDTSDTDLEGRGLDFDSLPVLINQNRSKIPIFQLSQGIPVQIRNYKQQYLYKLEITNSNNCTN